MTELLGDTLFSLDLMCLGMRKFVPSKTFCKIYLTFCTIFGHMSSFIYLLVVEPTYLFLLFSKCILFMPYHFWKYGVLSYFIFDLLMNFLKWFCAVVLLKIDQCDSWVVLATYLKPFYGEKMFFHPLHFVNLILDICPGDKLSIFYIYFDAANFLNWNLTILKLNLISYDPPETPLYAVALVVAALSV